MSVSSRPKDRALRPCAKPTRQSSYTRGRVDGHRNLAGRLEHAHAENVEGARILPRMKTLLVLGHAKSSWNKSALDALMLSAEAARTAIRSVP